MVSFDSDKIITFGSAGEAILTNPVFNEILQAWDESTIQAMLATKPEQRREREQLYATISATKEFLGFIQKFVQEMHALQEAPDELAQVDDPAVHDIYKEDCT